MGSGSRVVRDGAVPDGAVAVHDCAEVDSQRGATDLGARRACLPVGGTIGGTARHRGDRWRRPSVVSRYAARLRRGSRLPTGDRPRSGAGAGPRGALDQQGHADSPDHHRATDRGNLAAAARGHVESAGALPGHRAGSLSGCRATRLCPCQLALGGVALERCPGIGARVRAAGSRGHAGGNAHRVRRGLAGSGVSRVLPPRRRTGLARLQRTLADPRVPRSTRGWAGTSPRSPRSQGIAGGRGGRFLARRDRGASAPASLARRDEDAGQGVAGVHGDSRRQRHSARAVGAVRTQGLGGLLYWYAMYPAHLFIFSDMVHAVARLACREPVEAPAVRSGLPA